MTGAAFIAWTGHGAAVGAPPVSFRGAHAYVFAFDASKAAIQTLAERLLAPAARGQVRYSAATSAALVTFVDVARCAPLEHPIGWTTGRECAVWTLLWEHRAGGGRRRLVVWAPYVFINYSLGLITGREVWGWPKVGATISMSVDPPHQPVGFRCDTMIFRDFGHEVEGREETLIAVHGPRPHPPHTPWTGIGHALTTIGEHLSTDLHKVARRARPTGLRLPAITLKQFRDSQAPELACYQAIVNSPCRLTDFKGGGLLHGRFVLEFAQCRSHPILRDLAREDEGTTGSMLRPVKWAAWLNFDFEAERGCPVTD
jgi:hypothetical protein